MHSISSVCSMQGKHHDPASQQSLVKAHKPARLAKIPPLVRCAHESAPFDKGVYTRSHAAPASPEIGEEPFTRG